MGFFEKLFGKSLSREARREYKKKADEINNKEFDEKEDENPKLEKGDFFAMLIASFITIVLPSLLVIGVILGLLYLFFMR